MHPQVEALVSEDTYVTPFPLGACIASFIQERCLILIECSVKTNMAYHACHEKLNSGIAPGRGTCVNQCLNVYRFLSEIMQKIVSRSAIPGNFCPCKTRVRWSTIDYAVEVVQSPRVSCLKKARSPFNRKWMKYPCGYHQSTYLQTKRLKVMNGISKWFAFITTFHCYEDTTSSRVLKIAFTSISWAIWFCILLAVGKQVTQWEFI